MTQITRTGPEDPITTDPAPSDSSRVPLPHYGHATFFMDVQTRDVVHNNYKGYKDKVAKDFDGIPDKVAYIDDEHVIVQFGTRNADGSISYSDQKTLDISAGCYTNPTALFDVDGDKQWDHFAFSAIGGKMYLLADTSKTMEDIALKTGEVVPADGKLIADVNGDGRDDVVCKVVGNDRDTAFEVACKDQGRYTSDVKCMVDYISPNDRGIGTVYIMQQWLK